jgi:hypothetical protein
MESKQEQQQDKTPELAPFVAPWDGHAAADPGPGTVRTVPRHLPHLFSPLKIRDVTFKNRVVVSPMYALLSLSHARTQPHSGL